MTPNSYIPCRTKNGRLYFPAFSIFYVLGMQAVAAHHTLASPYFFTNNLPVLPWIDFVECFYFMTAGFLMAQTEVPEHITPGFIGKLAWHKLIRFYPLHLLVLAAYIILIQKAFRWDTLLANATLTHTLVPDSVFYYSYNSVSWFISCLFFLFIFYPIISKHIWFFLALSILIPTGILALMPQRVLNSEFFCFTPIFNAPKFILGILIFRLVRKIFESHPSLLAPPSWRQRTLWTAVEVLSILLLFVWHLHVSKWIYSETVGKGIPFIYLRLFRDAMLPTTVLLIVFSIGRGYASAIFSLRIFSFLATFQFSYYMLHFLCRDLILKHNLLGWCPIALRFTAYALITLLASCIIYYAYEKPASAYLKKIRQPQWLRQHAGMAMSLLIIGVFIWNILPKRVEYKGLVPQISYDHAIPGQIALNKPNSLVFQPGIEDARATYFLNGLAIDEFTCRLKTLSPQADVIINFHADGIKLKSCHLKGKQVIDVKIPLNQNKQFVIESDKNGELDNDSVVINKIHFTGFK